MTLVKSGGFFSFLLNLSGKGTNDISSDSNNSENCASDRCIARKLLLFCLTLVFAEVGIAGRTADSTGKTAFLGVLEKNENNKQYGNNHKNAAENISKDCHLNKTSELAGATRRIFSLEQGAKRPYKHLYLIIP